MPKIAAYHEGFMKKDILGFVPGYAMTLPILAGIGVVPIEPGTVLQGVHSRHDSQYTTIVYARCTDNAGATALWRPGLSMLS
jgi:hypothetical protein